MLIMDLIIPISMAVIGIWFVKSSGPKEINSAFGYRTTMSMKNRDTWEFAHTYCGKLWKPFGLAMALVSVVVMLFAVGKDIATVGLVGGVLCGAQGVFMVIPVIIIERALRKTFYKDGRRKE